eukprot:gene13616-9752_t
MTLHRLAIAEGPAACYPSASASASASTSASPPPATAPLLAQASSRRGSGSRRWWPWSPDVLGTA